MTFTLTSNATPDVFSGSTGNDTFTSAAGTFAASDVLVDASTTDVDVANFTMNTYSSTQGTLTNIETINATGAFTATGFDVAKVTGTKTLNLVAGVAGGSGVVANAASTRVDSIVAGSNVASLTVTSQSAGTVGTVNVDAGTAATISLNASAGSAASVTDSYKVKLNGTAATLTVANGATSTEAIETLTINSTGAANVVTLSAATAIVENAAATSKLVLSGDKNLTLIGDSDAITALAIEKSGMTGTTTFKTNAGGAVALQKASGLDYFDVTTDVGAVGVTLNEATRLLLNADSTATSYNVDNATSSLSSGTLKVDLNATQTAFATAAKAVTVELALNAANATITTLTSTTGGDVFSVSGSKNLTVGTWANGSADVISASALTGKLSVSGGGTNVFTAVGGSNDDTIVSTSAALTALGNGGNDIITGAAGIDNISGGDGNDVLTGAAGADTLVGGEGTDQIAGGAGNDSINISETTQVSDTLVYATGTGGSDTITGFVTGSDKFDTDFAPTATNFTFVTAAANTSAALALASSTKGVFKFTGVTLADANASTAASVLGAISNGTVTVSATSNKVMLALDTGAKTFLYEVTESGANTSIADAADTITLVGTFNSATLATNDII